MRKSRRKVNVGNWLPLFTGMVFGFVFLWVFDGRILQDEMFFGEKLFQDMEYLRNETVSYFVYLLKVRGLQLAFVILMSCIGRKKLGLGIWGWLTGIGFGIGEYAMVKKWGMPGVPGYLFLILPHYLCYFYSYIQYVKIDYFGQNKSIRKDAGTGSLGAKMMLIGVVIIGILLECYVNPFFVKLFSKIFL